MAQAYTSSAAKKTQPGKGAKRRGGFVQTLECLILDQDLSDAAHRLREIIAAKSWKTGTAKLSMPDLIELTGWSESKIRRARQELYDKRLLHFGKWKERRGPAVGSIYRLLDPGDPEPDEAAEQEGNPPPAADHPVTGDTPPCHQQQVPYKEGYEDLRELDIVCLSSSHLEVVWSQAEMDGRSPSPEPIQTQPRAEGRHSDLLTRLRENPGWTPHPDDVAMLDRLEDGPGKWVNLLATERRFRKLLLDNPTLARPSRIKQAWRRHVEWCPEEKRPWRLIDDDDPEEHCEAWWTGDDCPGCEEWDALTEPWGLDMKPTLKEWTESQEVRDQWARVLELGRDGGTSEVPMRAVEDVPLPGLEVVG